MPLFSIILPVLDEAPQIEAALNALAPLRNAAEIYVVDGGSTDGTVALARRLGHCVLSAPRGRANQMNAGARAARGAVLVFLHADCRLPDGALDAIRAARDTAGWGYFKVRLMSDAPLLRVVGALMNARSGISHLATGDQAIWVERALFEHVGGYPAIALMEDLALSRTLGRSGRPAQLAGPVRVSARRWEQDGAWRTILLMWRLRFAWSLGAHPDGLAARYYPPRCPQSPQATQSPQAIQPAHPAQQP